MTFVLGNLFSIRVLRSIFTFTFKSIYTRYYEDRWIARHWFLPLLSGPLPSHYFAGPRDRPLLRLLSRSLFCSHFTTLSAKPTDEANIWSMFSMNMCFGRLVSAWNLQLCNPASQIWRIPDQILFILLKQPQPANKWVKLWRNRFSVQPSVYSRLTCTESTSRRVLDGTSGNPITIFFIDTYWTVV